MTAPTLAEQMTLVCDDQQASTFLDDILAAQANDDLLHSLETLKKVSNYSDVNTPFFMLVDENGIAVYQRSEKTTQLKKALKLQVDFVTGAAAHRRKFGGGKGQMIAKAVGLNKISAKEFRPTIIDLTAGLGGDAFVLATLGCNVEMFERSLVAYLLLADGLNRAKVFAEHSDEALFAIVSRLNLTFSSAASVLQTPQKIVAHWDVVYLDPMFPERKKSAQVKKEMQIFHALIGADLDADQLLENALERANYRVVVKRPRIAPFLNNQKPSYQLEGKSSRYDIYTNKALPNS